MFGWICTSCSSIPSLGICRAGSRVQHFLFALGSETRKKSIFQPEQGGLRSCYGGTNPINTYFLKKVSRSWNIIHKVSEMTGNTRNVFLHWKHISAQDRSDPCQSHTHAKDKNILLSLWNDTFMPFCSHVNCSKLFYFSLSSCFLPASQTPLQSLDNSGRSGLISFRLVQQQ